MEGDLAPPFSLAVEVSRGFDRAYSYVWRLVDSFQGLIMVRMFIRLLLVVLAVFAPVFACAETPPPVGSYVDIKTWRMPISIPNPPSTTYYYDVSSYCAARIAMDFPGRTCANGHVVSTDANKMGQTWGYDRMYNGTKEWSYTSNATAWCDPAYYSGPAFDPAVPGIYKCKVVTPPPPQCPAGQIMKIRQTYGVSDASVNFIPDHYNGCNADATDVTYCGQYIATGIQFCDFTIKLTGGLYSGLMTTDVGGQNSDPSNRGQMPPLKNSGHIDCPKGSVQGGTDSDGVTPICIGTGSQPDNPKDPPKTTTGPTNTVTNADGSTTGTQVTTQQNSDGSVTTTTTTTVTGTDGTKTVTVNSTTSNNSTGGAGKTDTPQPPSDLCKQHPELTVCRNSSVSGTCGQIACMGDAIQCATLRAAAAMQCKQAQDDADLKASSSYGLGSSVLAGTDPAASTLPTTKNASTVAMPTSLDQTGWLGGGGSFFPDKTITVQGRTITIEFSKYGQYLLVFRYALMIVALLVSFKIVSGAVIRE